MSKGKKFIYKMALRYVFEIVLVVAFMIVSYKGFTMNNLSEASRVASLSESEARNVQAVYSYGVREAKEIREQELLNGGSLLLKNPNKTEKSVDVIMQVRKSEDYKIGDLNVLVNDEGDKMGVMMSLDEVYEINLGHVDLDAYESETLDIAVYSRVGRVPVEYSFKLVGSF